MNSIENIECAPTGSMLPENDGKPENDITKRCRKCKQLKSMNEFEFRKDTNNHRPDCKWCNYLSQQEWRKKNPTKPHEYYKRDWGKNKEKRTKKHLAYRRDNLEKCKVWEKKYKLENKPQIKEKNKKYRELHLDTIKKKQADFFRLHKDKITLKRKIKRNTDLQTKLKHKLRSRLASALKIRRVSKLYHTFDLIGCTPEFLTSYIKSKLKDEMTEQDLLNGKIHIDHIIPCAAFDLTKEEAQRKCFHYTNLQPLWAIDNLRKNAKIL